MKPLVLALALALAEPELALEITARDLDAASVERGVTARLGSPPDGWQIVAEPGVTSNAVHLRLRHVDGREIERDIELEQVEVEARSRELASVLALLIEESASTVDQPVEPPSSVEPPKAEPAAPPPPRTTGWLGVVGRSGFNAGRPAFADAGAALAGGVWLDRFHLQPVVGVGWSRASAEGLVLDTVRFGAGLLAGSDFARGRAWAGAGAIANAMWATARAELRASGWFSVTEILATIQYRGAWWTVGARVGVDVTLPPLTARGNARSRRWDAARSAFGVVLGVRIPPI